MMDPMALLEAESIDVMFTEVGRRLQPNRLFAYLHTHSTL